MYNSAGQLVKQVSLFDSRNAITKYYYDSAGNLTWQKIYQGDYWLETQHNYDERNRLTAIYQYTGNTIGAEWLRTSYIYDEVGNKLEVHTGYTDLSSQCRKTKYTDDRFGNITSISDPMDKSEQYSYNNIGLLECKTDHNGNKTTYQYDEIDRLTKLSVIVDNSNSSEKEYTCTLTGQKLVEISREVESGNTNILQTKYTYNEKGWLEKQTDPDGVTKEYSYDLNSNRRTFKQFKTRATSPDINLYYVYDSLNRLITVKKDGENGTTIAEYTYDDNGNRSKLKYPQSNIEAAYSYNRSNLVTSMENRRGGSLITGCNYTYYLDGNASVKTDKTPIVHHWDGQLIVQETVDGKVQNKYLRGVNLIALQDGGELRYYLFNLHGDVIQLVDKNGKTVSMYEYDAFGREKNTAGQDKNYDNNPFRYCEEYNDLETNTIYLRNRYYSPSFGLFTFEDSAGAGNNWYVYCNNNPIYYIDSKISTYWGKLTPVLYENMDSGKIYFEKVEEYETSSNCN